MIRLGESRLRLRRAARLQWVAHVGTGVGLVLCRLCVAAGRR